MEVKLEVEKKYVTIPYDLYIDAVRALTHLIKTEPQIEFMVAELRKLAREKNQSADK